MIFELLEPVDPPGDRPDLVIRSEFLHRFRKAAAHAARSACDDSDLFHIHSPFYEKAGW